MENTTDLQQKITLLQQEIATQENTLQETEKSLLAKNKRIRILEEYILSLQQKQFGSSSEKLEVLQSELLFTEAEDVVPPEQQDAFDAGTVVVATHSRKKTRTSIPAELPRVDITHDLLDAQKICPHDGTALKRIGQETHEQLDIIPATIQVLHHIRYKYACPCCEKYIITAQKPAQPIEKLIWNQFKQPKVGPKGKLQGCSL